jgi:nucleoid-associated protein YgaU
VVAGTARPEISDPAPDARIALDPASRPPAAVASVAEVEPAETGPVAEPATRGVDWRRLAEIPPDAGPAGHPAALPPPDPPPAEVETVPSAGVGSRAAAGADWGPAALLDSRTAGAPPAAAATAPAELAARAGSEEPAPVAGVPDPVRPSFDIVRVERDGRAVVAGRAAPGAEVELRAGDEVIDRVRASRRGEWVAMPFEPLPAGSRELSLAARVDDGTPVLSEQVLVVARPAPPPPQPAPVAAAVPPPPQPAPVAAAEPPPPQPADLADKAALAGPVAVLLPKDGATGGRVLQAPGRLSSDGGLALLVLDYDHAGQVRLTGEGPPGAPVRVYVDNQPSAEVVVAPSGQWTTVLGQQLAPGDYSLRLDQLGKEGRPVARLETPFTRVRQPPVAGAAQVDYVIVQPGNSLWRIARRLFGEGFRYVHIYDANQSQIRDPDLIYPGQVFEVPAALETAG